MYTKYNFFLIQEKVLNSFPRLHLEIFAWQWFSIKYNIFSEGGDFLRIIAIALYNISYIFNLYVIQGFLSFFLKSFCKMVSNFEKSKRVKNMIVFFSYGLKIYCKIWTKNMFVNGWINLSYGFLHFLCRLSCEEFCSSGLMEWWWYLIIYCKNS